MIKIYHNPRCSKSRQTLALLNEKGIEPEIVEYLKTPLNETALKEITQKLNCPPTQIIRFKEAVAKEQGITAKDQRSDEAWFAFIIQNPVLLERPVVINGNRAAIGRPPEKVLEIL